MLKHGLLKLFEYLCTLNTLHTRTILEQIKLGKQLPLAQNTRSKKGHAKAKTCHFPILLRINFVSILSNIEVVNVSVSSKYTNQPSARSALKLLCNKILQKKWQLQKMFTKS